MPIYQPTLPPRPQEGGGQPPILVLMRFDLARLLRQKLGRFFLIIFTGILLMMVAVLYFKYLLAANPALGGLQEFAGKVMTQGSEYQASHLDQKVLTPMWFLLGTVGAGVIARDSLFRIRPLIFAHPLSHRDYLVARIGFAALLPFALMLPFVLLPWAVSLLVAGKTGPVWASLPLHLIPAAGIVALLMGAVTAGASAMAGSPKAAFGWLLGIVLGTLALAGILTGVLRQPAFLAMSPGVLALAWPQILCGVEEPILPLGPALIGTLAHVGFWIFLAHRRTRPDEATL